MPDSLLSILLQKMLSIKVALWSVKRVGKLILAENLQLLKFQRKGYIDFSGKFLVGQYYNLHINRFVDV